MYFYTCTCSFIIDAEKLLKERKKISTGIKLITISCPMSHLMKRMAQFILKFINLIGDLKVQYIFARLYIALFLHVALNNLIKKLDERSKRNETSGTKRMGFLRHERRIITDSSFSGIPPIDSPSWAIATCSSI